MIRSMGVPIEHTPAVRPSASDSAERGISKTALGPSLRLPARSRFLAPMDPPDDDDTHGAPDPSELPNACACDDGLIVVETFHGIPSTVDCSCSLARPVPDDSLPFDS